jgi:hypothetical protein
MSGRDHPTPALGLQLRRVVAPQPTHAPDDPPSGIFQRNAELQCVPRLLLQGDALLARSLDHRAGFLVSLIAEGQYTVEDILDVCGMRREDALAILTELAMSGVIDFE